MVLWQSALLLHMWLPFEHSSMSENSPYTSVKQPLNGIRKVSVLFWHLQPFIIYQKHSAKVCVIDRWLFHRGVWCKSDYLGCCKEHLCGTDWKKSMCLVHVNQTPVKVPGSVTLPVHLRPSPIHPGAQSHLKLPAVLVQVACLWQLWAPISHSLISKEAKG